MNNRPLSTTGPVTADDVRAATFQLIRRGGYDPAQVDPFLELIAQTLEGGPDADPRLDAAAVHGVRFTTVRRGGYLPAQVDALLDRVIDTFHARTAAAPAEPSEPRRPPASVETARAVGQHTRPAAAVDTSPEADFERLKMLHRSRVLSDKEFAVLGARVRRRIEATRAEPEVSAFGR